MATNYTSVKCDCCGGAIEFQKERNVWVCKYCGNEMVREESYDGQYSIKWVARQALLSLADRDMAGAQAQLVECTKIDPHYVGTIIARLAYAVVSMSTASSSETQRRLTSQVDEAYAVLKRTPLMPGSDEENFYYGLDSSDACGVLALVYDTVGDEGREKFIVATIDPSSVYSATAARDMVRYALADGKVEMVDQLIESPAELDCDLLFPQLLGLYPDTEQKSANATRVVEGIQDKDAAGKVLTSYLASTRDGLAVRLVISKACYAAGVRPALNGYLASLLPLCEDAAQARSVFQAPCGTRLSDEDVALIVGYCAATAPATLGATGIQTLKESGQFASPSQGAVVSALTRTDLALDQKTDLLSRLYGFEQPERFRQSVISTYLRDGAAAPDRPQLVGFLVGTVSELNPVLVEDYLTHSSTDGADKAAIMDALLSKSVNASTLKRGLSSYLRSSPDSPEVTQSVAAVFITRGLVSTDIDVVSAICSSGDIGRSVATAKAMKSSGWKPGSHSLDTYLLACARGSTYSSELATELFDEGASISPEALSTYVLRCVEAGSVKPQWVRALAARTASKAASVRCRIGHQGRNIDCNVLQAYLLAPPDPDPVARLVLQEIESEGFAEAPISVTDASGCNSMKFKRYANANKAALSAASLEFCESHRLLGGLFG